MGLNPARVGQGPGLGSEEQRVVAGALAGDEVKSAVAVPVADRDCCALASAVAH